MSFSSLGGYPDGLSFQNQVANSLALQQWPGQHKPRCAVVTGMSNAGAAAKQPDGSREAAFRIKRDNQHRYVVQENFGGSWRAMTTFADYADAHGWLMDHIGSPELSLFDESGTPIGDAS